MSAVVEGRVQGHDASPATRTTAPASWTTSITDPTKATPSATAVRADGTTFPWGVRSGNLTYLGEIPFSYITPNDRYLAFSDLLFDVLAPATAARHRALVRIEDVGPDADPAELRPIADYLSAKNVPFTVGRLLAATATRRASNTGGVAEDYTLRQTGHWWSAALKYMQSHGGTLLDARLHAPATTTLQQPVQRGQRQRLRVLHRARRPSDHTSSTTARCRTTRRPGRQRPRHGRLAAIRCAPA